MDYTTFTLDNGLRVVHSPMEGTAMVAVDVLYNVGARDEEPEHTGLAHLFEHLMFGGSANAPDFDGVLSAAGGTSNAWTSCDFTNFYDILPAQNIETAFFLESDRMRSPSFLPGTLATQKSVVTEEFKQTCLNQPYGDLWHIMLGMLYGTERPYGWPVIGKTPGHIEAVTEEYARNFFFSHYSPDNAVLAVAGNADLNTVRRLAEKYFAPIAPRHVAPRQPQSESGLSRDAEQTAYGSVPNTLISTAVRMGGYNSRLYTEADVITDLLANGRSGRFTRELVLGSDLFLSAEACISGYEDSGWLMLQGVPSAEDDATIAACTEALWREARRLAEAGEVTQYAMDRAYNRVETEYMISNMNYRRRALTLAKAVMHGEEPDAFLRRMRVLTPEDIRSAAANLLFRPKATLYYRPKSRFDNK